VIEGPARPTPPWADRVARWRDAVPLPLPVPAAALAAGALVVVAAFVAVAVLINRGSSPAAPVVLPRADTGPAAGPVGPDSAAAGRGVGSGSGSESEKATSVTVHAAGAVARPGVYVLAADARVADVVTAAGGATPEADVDQLNLATRVADGDRVYLPRRGETPPAAPSAGSAPSGPGGGPASSRAVVLDLNTAAAGQLELLPGIGPALATAIVEHRNRNGRFRSVDDLLDVPGIGPAKLATLRPLVRV